MILVESNLNLRVLPRGELTHRDYYISPIIAERLSNGSPDFICMVEYMECQNANYLKVFHDRGYDLFTSLDRQGRGILIAVLKSYAAVPVFKLDNPHFLHLRCPGNDLNLIVMRIKVGKKYDQAEFLDRRRQFLRILSYLDSLPADTIRRLAVTGDFNNARILNDYRGYSQEHYNYQFICEEMAKRGLTLRKIDGYSHKGYLKEDHIITGSNLLVRGAQYDGDMFADFTADIGVPDHSTLYCDFEYKSREG